MIFIKLKGIKGKNYSFCVVHVHVVTWDKEKAFPTLFSGSHLPELILTIGI